MKRMICLAGLIALLITSTSSCVATKRDCQGHKKTRLPNGIYI